MVSKRMASDGFLVAFSERTGGVSPAPFDSLNLGLGTDDERGRVVANRRRACDALGIRDFACARQEHGGRAARIGPQRRGAGFEDPANAIRSADALSTAARSVMLGCLTADCVPIALADPGAGRVAVVHAGWRGIVAGVVTAALNHFASPARVSAAIGPAIGPDHYEVGEDVALAVSASSAAGAPVRHAGSSLYLDLPGTVARALKEHGVRTIERAEECTACEPARFFSHRRDRLTGRQALIAGRL